MIYIGKNISLLRGIFNYSQPELATKLDVTGKAISNYENAVSYPDFKKLYQLRDIFNLSADILIYANLAEMTPAQLKETLAENHVHAKTKKGAK